MSIENLRSEIDSIDEQIIKLFEKRMEVSGKIAEYKKENSLPVFDEKREREILKKLSDSSSEEMKPYVHALYEKVFELSRLCQEKLIKPEE